MPESNVFNNSCEIRINNTCDTKPCPEGTECCQEPDSKISICCALGSCDKSTGHCSIKTKNTCENNELFFIRKKWYEDFSMLIFVVGMCILIILTIRTIRMYRK